MYWYLDIHFKNILMIPEENVVNVTYKCVWNDTFIFKTENVAKKWNNDKTK